MTAPDRKLKVGVTLHVRKGVQSMWENGIFQNCVFLAQLLSLSPVVEQAYIVCSGDGSEEDWQRFIGDVGFPLLGLAEAQSVLDVVVEMSAGWARTGCCHSVRAGARWCPVTSATIFFWMPSA